MPAELPPTPSADPPAPPADPGPAPEPPPRRWTRYLGAILFALFFGGLWFGLRWLNATLEALDQPASTHPAYKVVDIPEGASPYQIATLLHDHGLIRDRQLFVLYARWRRADNRLKYGEYRFNTTLSTRQVLDKLVAGNVLGHRFIVRPGDTIRAVAEELERRGLAKAADIMRLTSDQAFLSRFGITAPTAEGYLYPETYHVARGVSPEHLIELMLLEYREQVVDLQDEIAASGFTEYDVLKMASVIEKEALLEQELPLVSAVLYNRMERNMPLQCDVTIRYPLDNYGQHLTYTDLALDSPYNSYKYKGLPPTPICNPGRAAIEAALRPADVDYLYFVSMNSGAHHFSRTYAEHKAAVKKYQVQNERGPREFPGTREVEQRPRPGATPEDATEVMSTTEAFPGLTAGADEVQLAGRPADG